MYIPGCRASFRAPAMCSACFAAVALEAALQAASRAFRVGNKGSGLSLSSASSSSLPACMSTHQSSIRALYKSKRGEEAECMGGLIDCLHCAFFFVSDCWQVVVGKCFRSLVSELLAQCRVVECRSGAVQQPPVLDSTPCS